MSSIYFLIACSIFVALLFLVAFLWAQKSGQNDDLYTPSIRMLMDDEDIVKAEEENGQQPAK
jgi:cbb3-type cytochrome oxidase maturation protein